MADDELHLIGPDEIAYRLDLTPAQLKITFTAQDIAHSFTVEGYRIMKRAGAGQSVTFEFRADQAGQFTFYCNLSQDEKCKDMKGTLTVR